MLTCHALGAAHDQTWRPYSDGEAIKVRQCLARIIGGLLMEISLMAGWSIKAMVNFITARLHMRIFYYTEATLGHRDSRQWLENTTGLQCIMWLCFHALKIRAVLIWKVAPMHSLVQVLCLSSKYWLLHTNQPQNYLLGRTNVPELITASMLMLNGWFDIVFYMYR